DAWRKYFDYLAAVAKCEAEPPPGNLTCLTEATQKHCVRLPPGPSDFTVHVEGLTTYFDGARTEDALVVGNVAQMALTFGDNAVQADFVLEDIAGKMQGQISAADVWMEYRKATGDPCKVKPDDRQVVDFMRDSVDYGDWFVCR